MRELTLEVLLEPERTGETVVEVWRRGRISRQTFYLHRRPGSVRYEHTKVYPTN